jgi:DNA replication protein DnaC
MPSPSIPPSLADAILDRLVHNAYHLKLEGDSMRKARGIAAGAHD